MLDVNNIKFLPTPYQKEIEKMKILTSMNFLR